MDILSSSSAAIGFAINAYKHIARELGVPAATLDMLYRRCQRLNTILADTSLVQSRDPGIRLAYQHAAEDLGACIHLCFKASKLKNASVWKKYWSHKGDAKGAADKLGRTVDDLNLAVVVEIHQKMTAELEKEEEETLPGNTITTLQQLAQCHKEALPKLLENMVSLVERIIEQDKKLKKPKVSDKSRERLNEIAKVLQDGQKLHNDAVKVNEGTNSQPKLLKLRLPSSREVTLTVAETQKKITISEFILQPTSNNPKRFLLKVQVKNQDTQSNETYFVGGEKKECDVPIQLFVQDPSDPSEPPTKAYTFTKSKGNGSYILYRIYTSRHYRVQLNWKQPLVFRVINEKGEIVAASHWFPSEVVVFEPVSEPTHLEPTNNSVEANNPGHLAMQQRLQEPTDLAMQQRLQEPTDRATQQTLTSKPTDLELTDNFSEANPGYPTMQKFSALWEGLITPAIDLAELLA